MNRHHLPEDFFLLHLALLQKAKKVKHQAPKGLFVSLEVYQVTNCEPGGPPRNSRAPKRYNAAEGVWE